MSLNEPTQKKHFLSGLPLHRISIYASIIATLPLLCTIFFSLQYVENYIDLEKEVRGLEQDTLLTLQSQLSNREIIYQFQNADPLYLNKTVEGYRPLQKEHKTLQELQQYGGFPDAPIQERRYRFLSSGENIANFTESAATISPLLKETIETQNKPIELDTKDLISILGYIEGNSVDSPLKRAQFIVLEGSLDRKKGYDHEVWGLNLKILKRLYTSTIQIPENQKNHTTTLIK